MQTLQTKMISSWTVALLVLRLATTVSWGLDHAPSWPNSATCSYGLPGEGSGSQYVDEMAVGGYALCRFGNLINESDSIIGRETLSFNYLTSGPFDTVSMDSPRKGGLFVWGYTGSSNRRYTFTELNASNWVLPPSGGSGRVDVDGSPYIRNLYRYFTMSDAQLPGINSTIKKYVILIHGWNPDSLSDSYQGSQFSHLADSVQSWLTSHGGTSWKLLKYHMEQDTDTGPIINLDAAKNGTEAAEIARLQGYHMAQLILEKCPSIQSVHLIAHSAGAWAARSCLQYLLANNSHVVCQMTLLDAYVPEVNNSLQPESVLGVPEMNAITSFSGTSRIFGLDNYFASKSIGDIPDPALGTQEEFAWGTLEILPDTDTSDYSQNQWNNHHGPIEYYADSVDFEIQNGGSSCWAFSGGWSFSLAYHDLAVVGIPSSLSATAVSSSQINLSWSDVSNETGYKVERRLYPSGSWSQIATRPANVTSYSDTGRPAGTKYQYQVRAYNASGDSDYSSIATAATQTAQPPPETTHTLTIASANPSSGAGVSSYVGTGQYAQGTTPTSRSFAHGSVVGVNVWYSTLPSGQIFQKWQLDGVDYAYTTTTSVPLDDAHTLTAIYGATPPVARTLTDLTIEGSSSVDEGCAAQYKALASYSDGSSGYVIASWNDDSSYASISSLGLLDADAVSVDEDVMIDASFTAGGVTRTDSKSVTIYNTDAVPTYTLTRNCTAGGSIGYSPQGNAYAEGTVVSLHANPDDDYVFSHWSGDASGTEDDITITMNSERSVTAHFSLDPSYGRLQVVILPSQAAIEGAQWKYDNFTAWRESGNIQDGISPRINRNIYFKDIPGWITPEYIKASVIGGKTTVTNASYREILGAVQVTIMPDQAKVAGGRWRIDGGPWTESGVTKADLSTGDHTIEFLSFEGWGAPPSQSVSVARGVTTTPTGAYTPPVGLPIITAVSPRTSPIEGGTMITIDGANFQSGASVSFGGNSATSVTVVSPTRITAVSPPRASYGTVPLSITSGGQTVTQTNGFSYLNALGSNIELVGQIGGDVQAVAVVGSMAYYGEGPGLVVSDFSNSASPVERGRIALPNPVQDISIVSNIAFVVTGAAGLYAVDISSPTDPSIIGFFDTEGSAVGVCVMGGFAYVGDGAAGLQILNVTNPACMFRVGGLDITGSVMRVSAGVIGSKKYVFTAERGKGSAMRVIDVTTPSSPAEVTNVPGLTSLGISDVKLVGTKLYMSDYAEGIKIFNVSNPSNIVQTGNYSGLSSGAFLDVVGSRLYTYAGNLQVANLSVTPVPSKLGTFDAGLTCYKLVVVSNLAFIATGGDGLKTVNVTTPSSMSLRSTIQTLGTVEDVWVSGGVAYVGNATGLHTLDVSNPARPFRLATLAGDRVTDIAVVNDKATLVNYGDKTVRIVNVANPSSLGLLGTYTNVVAWNVALLGSTSVLAAVTKTSDKLPKIDVLNLSSPTSPKSSGSLVLDVTNSTACGIAIAGNWAFVGRQGDSGTINNALDVVSLANPASPQKVGSLVIPPFSIDVAASVDGDYVYIPLGTGIQIVDVRVKTAPVVIQVIDPPQTAGASVWHVEVAGDRLFAVESGVLFIFNIANPASPILMGYYDIPSEGYGISVVGDLVFVAGFNAGVTILRLKDLENPTVSVTLPTMNAAITTTNGVLSVGGVATDDKGVSRITWSNDRGGGGVAQGTTTWSITNLQLAVGVNRVIVTAEDANGNLGTDSLDITATFLDTTPPVVTITGPKPDSEFTVDTPAITLSGSAVDNQAVNGMTCSNYLIAAGMVVLTGQTWSVTNLQLALGPNFIQMTATDAAGNRASDTAVIFLVPPDTNAPSVSIDFPTLNATFETGIGAINLSGTATDDREVSEVKWTSTVGTQGVANGVAPWSANGIMLQPGFNLIDVSAKDAAGNVSSDTLSVNYTPPPVVMGGGVGVSNGVFRFDLAGPLGRTFIIETSSNLVQWAPFSSNTIPGEDAITITDPGATNCPLRFYRATEPTNTNSGLSQPALNIGR